MMNLLREETAEQSIAVTIEKMVYGGEGLARTPEGVLLVPGAITGEQATVLPEPARKGVRRARLLEVTAASAERITPGCAYYSRCGGCQYQHISYAAQLEAKKQILAECFERIGKLRLDVPIHAIASEPWGYRNRVRLQVEKDAAGVRVGYLEHASHTLAAVDACPIAMPAIEAIIRQLSAGALQELFPEGTAELELFSNEDGSALLATVCSSLPAPEGFGDAWRGLLPQFKSVCWSQRAAREKRERNTVWGSGALTYHLHRQLHQQAGEFHYRISHHTFFQANRTTLGAMIEAATGNCTGRRALDLYAGAGLFTLPLARRFEHVAAVETHPAAARDLAANCGVMGTRVRAHHKSVEQFLSATTRNWDLVLVDPPRTGLTPAVTEGLKRLAAAKIVYVSCDPTTLARDLKAMIASGYEIASVHLVDQFPQSYHIESIVHLARHK